jgi:FdhD protein
VSRPKYQVDDEQAADGQSPISDLQSPAARGTVSTRYITLGAGPAQEIDGDVVEEALACITVNGHELATFMCSPRQIDRMALGFLYNEGIIESREDVRNLHLSQNGTCADVWLWDAEKELPQRPIVTAGCGGGITFDDLSQQHTPLQSELRASAAQLASLMRQMHQGAELYQRARGIHTAALCEEDRILLQVEDVGRHNCLDKLAGGALLEELATRDRLLMSSGRISSEMLNKARRMEIPIVCSRTSPTSLSVSLAEAWNITIVAYLRQDRMRIYTHPERIAYD